MRRCLLVWMTWLVYGKIVASPKDLTLRTYVRCTNGGAAVVVEQTLGRDHPA